MTAVVFVSSRPRFHVESVRLKVGYSGGPALMLDGVCAGMCVLSVRVASTLAWPPVFLRSADRPEGGSREALDNPVWAPGRQRKWLDVPDGGHNQENSCKGLNFYTRAWNGFFFLLLLSPLSCLLPPPAAASVSFLKFQTTNNSLPHIQSGGCLQILPVFDHLYLLSNYFLSHFPFSSFFSLWRPYQTFFSHSFPFRKRAASIWLWSSFTFLFLPSLKHRPLFNPPIFLALH